MDSQSEFSLLATTEAPGNFVDPREAAGNFVDPREAPGNFVDPRQAPGNFVDLREAPGNFVDPREAPGNFVDPRAHGIYYRTQHWQRVSTIDYTDFMRGDRQKAYQRARRREKVGNYLEILKSTTHINWRNCVPSSCRIIESQYHTCQDFSDRDVTTITRSPKALE